MSSSLVFSTVTGANSVRAAALALACAVALLLLSVAYARPEVGLALAFVLLTLSPGLVGPRAWVPAAAWAVVLVVLGIMRGDESGSRTGLSLLATATAIYVAALLASWVSAPDAAAAAPVFRNTVTGLLLFWVAARYIRTATQVKWVLAGIAGSLVLPCAVALHEYLTNAPTGFGRLAASGAVVGRATGGFGHPNQLSGLLLLLIPFALAAAAMVPRARLLYLALSALGVLALLTSVSRAALVGLVALPLVALASRRPAALGAVAGVAFAVSAGFAYFVAARLPRGLETVAEGRGDIWRIAAAIWSDRPLLGGGPGSFPDSYLAVAYVGKAYLPNSQQQPPPHAHNFVLQHLAEGGVIGLIAVMAVLVLAVLMSVDLVRGPLNWARPFGAAMVAMISAFLVQNQLDYTLVENNAALVWALLGVLLGLTRVVEDG